MEVPLSNKPNSLNPNSSSSSSSSSSSVRVLVRSPSSTSSSSPSSKTHLIPSTSSPDPPPSSSSNGVVVVGFIGPRAAATTHLINRIVDANVFGSGNSDKCLFVYKEHIRGWFESRRISYYHDHRKGVLFLQFSPSSRFGHVSASEVEELEFGDLQGTLFMFSVCHVIIQIQDGLRFDTQILKKFRVLQAAKQGLTPFVRSQITSNSVSPLSSQSSRPTTNTTSPSKHRSIFSRGGSSVLLMSGLGSRTSLFPGQCTPVMLFVFIDDFSDIPNPSSNVEESSDTPASHNQSSSGSLVRPNLPAKVSNPVVVLARSVNKSEGGFRKKLQSSLEAQVRFLIKKCRILSSTETAYAGSRGAGVSSSVPLFSLDSSRAVILLDRSVNQIGVSLEFATGLVEDVLKGKATSDSLLLENRGQVANKEDDILLVKDFIDKQSDILRGKGSLVSNSSSGPAGGVGMVAVAAAVAAAASSSASIPSGKVYATPELPNTEIWLSSSQLILEGILSAKGESIHEIEITKRKPRLRNGIPPPAEGAVASKGADPLDMAVSWLGSGKGLNTRFSTSWCERTLPTAKEVYLKDLPACYPTLLHEARLDMAMQAFHSMVKGPAVQLFAKKLEEECTAIWKSGRQLCDAVSLTGKPCMHHIHDVQTSEVVSGSCVKPHCSGYVFLHACACGRSRRLRLDPFDFESANVDSDCLADCDKLLPALQLPSLTDGGPVQASSWSLIRVGGAKYYEPSKGLIQSGFYVTHKFLLKWEILLEYQKNQDGLTMAATVLNGTLTTSCVEPKFEPKLCTDETSTIDLRTKPSEIVTLDDKKISFGKDLPNAKMRKPFAEVVAGSASGENEFPPLRPLRKQHPTSIIKQNKAGNACQEQNNDSQRSGKSEVALNGINTNNSFTNGEPYLRIGSYAGPVFHNPGEKIRKNPSFTSVTAYVGFEHECPSGHRFILNPDHLKKLENFYQLPEESQLPNLGTSDYRYTNTSKINSSGRRGKVHQNSNSTKKDRNVDKSKELRTNGRPDLEISFGVSNECERDFRGNLDCVRVDNCGQAFSMLNRNLPLYMKCPHCRDSKNQGIQKVNFAGTVSQLQRIFLVTPPFPVVLATCPLIQFEASCLPASVPQHEEKLRFSLGCDVVLPPESFLTLRLPFVYGVQLEDGTLHSFNYFDNQPESTAWITQGTTLRVVSKINSPGQ